METRKQRSTRQKKMIYDYLAANQNRSVTAREISGHFKRTGLTVGQSTIYRALKALLQSGEVKMLRLPEEQEAGYRFVGENAACDNHFHLLCDRCGSIQHVEGAPGLRIAREVKKSFGFSPDEGKTTIHGVCTQCRED